LYVATNDAYDLNATSSGDFILGYSIIFIQRTRSLGVFISILFRENGMTNFEKSLFFVQNEESAAAANRLSLPSGNYMTLVYDLESDGTISIEQPADQEMITLTGSSADPTSENNN